MMARMSSEVAPVRAGEELDWRRVAEFLREHRAAAGLTGLDLSRHVDVAQFPGGHSNLTYLLRFATAELVLRRPPLGPVAPKAHDMSREYHWLTALHRVFPLAPRPYLLCEDVNVAGAVFYVMERRRGFVIRAEEPPSFAEHPDERRRLSTSLVDTLAALHAIDIERAGLAHLGKPAGFVARQIHGWTDRWDRSRLDEVPEMESLSQWLHAHLPPEPPRPAIVHGDFKLDNVMLDADDPARLVAVLDWEMTALGDPLVDLGILLAYWCHVKPVEGHDALTSVTAQRGWFSRDEIMERYAAASGFDLRRLRFYEAFALFKIAVVIQQIYYRYRRGQTTDPRFARFGARVTQLARQAATFAT
jgi:aminoglycoside phosphotransferase (APT) family kinase protein